MAVWLEQSIVPVSGDILSGSLPAKLGVEQYFSNQPVFGIPLMQNARKFRSRYHLSLDTAAGTSSTLSGVLTLTACSLRLRMLLQAINVDGSNYGSPTVIGDSGNFFLTAANSLVNTSKAQIYIHHVARLISPGSAGSSSLSYQGWGFIFPGSGIPVVGITMPKPTNPVSTMDCGYQQKLIVAATFGSFTGANQLTLDSIAAQITD